MTDRIDTLVAGLAPVADEELVGEVLTPTATALLVSILDSPLGRPRPRPGRSRRRRWAAFALAAAAATVLSIPAFGVGHQIVSLFAGMHDPDAPVPTASDVVIASGEAGVPWKLVATKSDRGLCYGIFHRVGNDRFGPGGCGYIDIRGDLPRDIRGDPASRCLGPPTTLEPGGTLVPCGSLQRHWIGPVGGSGASLGLEATFAFGPLAKDVARVDLVLTNGQTLPAEVVEQPGGIPLNFYWATWPCPLQPVRGNVRECAEDAGPALEMAIARDEDGRVLERRVPAWNGNPTGRPEGPAPPS